MQLAIDKRCTDWTSGAWLRLLRISHLDLVLPCALAAVALSIVQPAAHGVSYPAFPDAISRMQVDEHAGRASGRIDEQAIWLQGTYKLGEPPDKPIAFHMSGLFSAELWWNGRLVGRKGIPADRAANEVAGPIDAAIVLPRELLRSDNRWSLQLSSHHAGYSPGAPIQDLHVGPYRPGGRSLEHYLTALLLFGAVLACSLWALSGWSIRRDRRKAMLALSALCLGGALAAEVARGIVNYPYDWHVVRQSVTLVLLATHAAALLLASLAPTDRRATFDRMICAASLLGMMLGIATLMGFDQKMLGVLGASYTGMAARTALRAPSKGCESALGILSLIAMAMLLYRMEVHLDAGAYAFGLALLTVALVLVAPVVPHRADRGASEARRQDHILLGFPGSERIVRWSDVQALRAAGNYSRVILREGSDILDRRGLSKLLDLAPPNLVRVHRSHAVDIKAVRSLESARRGTYQLVFAGGQCVPLSRGRYPKVRERLAKPLSDVPIREDGPGGPERAERTSSA